MGSPGRATAGDVSSPQLAGRQPELDRLRAALHDAQRARPSLVLLTGDAGLGKTRLTKELELLASEQGALVLRGQCLELSLGELPYAPIASALRSAEASALAAALEQLPSDARRELARAFPDTIDETPAEPVRDDRFGQARLFGWILGLLRELTGAAPVLLTVEDVHLADTSSRDWLRFLVQSLRSERLLTIATIRSDELHREHPARALITELQRHETVARIELSPLSEAAVREQIAGIIGGVPSPDVVRRLYRRGQGNPFYTEELLAAGTDEAAGLPASLQDALLVRADRLDEHARELLRVVSAAGRPVDGSLLERASERPRREVETGLRQCVDRGVLVCDRRTGQYSVRHGLIGDAVYGDLLPVERVSLHRGIATALTDAASAENAGERAHHWQLADEPAEALLASIEAATAAERVFGYGEALAHFQLAVDLWERAPPEPGATPLDRTILLARAAQAARWMGDSDTALELCNRALGSFDHAEDPLRAARLYERLGRYQPWDIEGSLAAFGKGLELLPSECTAERMRLYVDEALELSFLGRWEETRARATDAIGLADGEDTMASESAARALLGTAIAFLGDPAAGERDLRAALALAKRAESTEDLVQIYLDLGEVLRLEGRIEDALKVMLEGEGVAVAVGAVRFGNFMAANAADDLLRLGRWGELAERLAELGRRELDRPAELLRRSVAGRLEAAIGRREGAAAHFEAAAELCEDLDLVEFVPAVYSGYAELELARDDAEAARQRIADGFGKLGTGENLLHIPPLHSTGARVEADLAELARARRDVAGAERAVEAARAHHARLAELLASHGDGARPPEARAHLAECAAEVTRAARQPDPSVWAQAASLWAAHDNRYRVAYARFRHAEALVLARAPRAEAQSELDAAAALSDELGAETLTAEIRALRRRARLGTATPATPAVQVKVTPAEVEAEVNPYGLTERELEVLRLLAAGMTNREISQELFISQHTAGVHVSHILGKLGVANRVMAAGVAERLGLAPRA